MRKTTKQKWLLLFLSICIPLAAGEIYVRHKGRFDADGNFYFIFKRFKPYKLPIKQVAAAVEEYERENNLYIMYNPDLGWAIRPGIKKARELTRARWLDCG